jgi:gliding motility-associated-like protein
MLGLLSILAHLSFLSDRTMFTPMLWENCLLKKRITKYFCYICSKQHDISKSKYFFLVVLLLQVAFGYCQAPTVSYASPQIYKKGTAIPPLVPGGSDVGPPGYGGSAVTFASGINGLLGIATDAAGNVYAAEGGSYNEVVKIPAGGGPAVVIGSGFNSLSGLSVDAAGNIYVIDSAGTKIKKIPFTGGAPVTIGSGFRDVQYIAVDVKDNVFVTDAAADEVIEIPAGRNARDTVYTIPTDPWDVYTIEGITVDAADNLYLYYMDYFNGGGPGGQPSTSFEVTKCILNGPTVVNTVVSGGNFGDPTNIFVDAAGNVYVDDPGQHVLFKYSGSGTIWVPLVSGFSSSLATIDGKGNLYFAANTQIEKLAPSGGYYIGTALPAGLSFANTTGIISGTPTIGSPPKNYTIIGYNAAGSGSAQLNISVLSSANLSNITTSRGTLSPVFAPGTTSYTALVGSGITTIQVTPTAADSTATIKVNGAAVANKTASGPIALAVGTNTITVMVTAQDGVTTQTYTIAVTRPVSSNDNLAFLAVTFGALTPAFSTGTTSYTVNVGNSLSFESVKPYASDSTSTIKVNGTAVTSGTVSGEIAMNAGPNQINVVVTAQDGVTTQTYTITVNRAPSNSAYLYTLQLSSGTTAPFFQPYTYNYTSSVAYATSSITLTPTAIDSTSKIIVNGMVVANKMASAPIALAVGANTITIVVTAQDGVATETYTVTVTRAPSNNDNLSSLKISAGTLTPAFAPGTTSYTASVGNGISSLTVMPTTSDPTATVKVNGTAAGSGSASAPIPLTVGPNTITTGVTAQDGTTTKTYSITVTRAPSNNAYLLYFSIQTATLSPGFAYKTFSYITHVPNSTTSVTVTPSVLDLTATVKVNGTAVVNKTASGPIALAVGANTINIVVTAQDGVTTQTYTVTITRAASANDNLSYLKISQGTLTPVFATATTSYTASVGNGVTSLTITPTTQDATASVKVNGTTVTSGAASAAIPLNVGVNTIKVLVTAQNGATIQIYKITVTRAPSSNAYLLYLSVKTSKLSPTFAYNTFSYTGNVITSITSVKVIPSLLDPTATVKVNGEAVANKTKSRAIAMAIGTNKITVLVTAQDGKTTQTYDITVTRAAYGADSYDPGISVTKPIDTPTVADDGVVIHQGVSPNGDGIDDFLQIDNITNCPDNKLMIMNRNGQLIYEAKGYDNSSKVFDGHSNKNGQMQLPGTYFYQLDYTVNGITKHKTGFLVLKY